LLIYFISNEEGYIKIGYTNNLKQRLQSLKTGSSSKIYLCGFINSGTYKMEQELHKKFRYLKKQGEWFICDESLSSYINDNSDMMAEIENVDGRIYVYQKMRIVR
jgi:hypothetical protein